MFETMNAEVLRISKSVMGGDNRICNHEDLAQDVWVKLIEPGGGLEKISNLEEVERKAVIRKMAAQAFSNIIDQYFLSSDQYYYHNREVRGFLEKGTPYGSEAGIDLILAMETLEIRYPHYYKVITLKYTVDQALDAKQRMQLTRGVDMLVEFMNDQHNARERAHDNGPGSRTVVTNAAAQFRTKNQD